MMQLRRTLTWTAVGLVLITFTACVALVLSTTSLRRNVDDLDRAYRVSRFVSSLAHQSIRHELETSSMGRTLSEAQSQVFLGRAIELTRSPDERQVLEDLRLQLEKHWRSATNDEMNLPLDLVSALIHADELFAAQADAQSRRARNIDMIANVVGVAIAVLLAAGLLFFSFTINQFVFRPVNRLAGCVDRFAGGDLNARARSREPRRSAASPSHTTPWQTRWLKRARTNCATSPPWSMTCATRWPPFSWRSAT